MHRIKFKKTKGETVQVINKKSNTETSNLHFKKHIHAHPGYSSKEVITQFKKIVKVIKSKPLDQIHVFVPFLNQNRSV